MLVKLMLKSEHFSDLKTSMFDIGGKWLHPHQCFYAYKKPYSGAH